MRVQAISLEGGLPEPETTAPVTLRNRPTEALFDDSLHGCLLSLCQLPQLFVKTVWYLYGCLHMISRIPLYGSVSSYAMETSLKISLNHPSPKGGKRDLVGRLH